MRRLWREPDIERASGFSDFVVARTPSLLGLARGLSRSDPDAEDLLQDVLTKALLKWDVVSRADDPDAYLNRMLVNTAISSWRRGYRRESATPPENLLMPSVEDQTGAVVERDALVQALRRLPIRHRAVLVLRYYEGLSDAEIAVTLDMAPATVRSYAARGLAALRRTTLFVGVAGSPSRPT
jgi:RNA polymerase sigma-70 factor (sigma-E family)